MRFLGSFGGFPPVVLYLSIHQKAFERHNPGCQPLHPLFGQHNHRKLCFWQLKNCFGDENLRFFQYFWCPDLCSFPKTAPLFHTPTQATSAPPLPTAPQATEYARAKGLPRVYIACNSGARVGLVEELMPKLRVQWWPGLLIFFLFWYWVLLCFFILLVLGVTIDNFDNVDQFSI